MYPKKCVYHDNGHDIEPAVDTKTEQKLKVIMTSPDQREGTPLGVRTMEEPRKDNGRTKEGQWKNQGRTMEEPRINQRMVQVHVNPSGSFASQNLLNQEENVLSPILCKSTVIQ